MNLGESKSYLQAVDSLVVGRLAFDEKSRNIRSHDGSIVLCGDQEALDRWVDEQNLQQRPEHDWQCYGGLIESLTLEGISFHMDAGAFANFSYGLSEDFRFWPEILSFEENGWITVTSAFDMFNDDIEILRAELDNAIIGYRQENGLIAGPEAEMEPEGAPITYKAYRAKPEDFCPLDAVALCRVKSLLRWEAIYNDIKEA